MSNPARRIRRTFGLAFLALAILLLLAGQTLLRDRLHGARYALYWLTCLFLVALALLCALLDLRLIRRHARRQQLNLIQETLGHHHPAELPPEITPPPHPPD